MAIVAYPRAAHMLTASRSRRLAVREQTTFASVRRTGFLYPFNDAGLIYKDIGSYHQHLKPSAVGPTWSPDFGGCLDFTNATGNLVSAAPMTNALYDVTVGTKEIVVDFWVKTTANTQDIWAIQGSATGNSLIIISIGPNAGYPSAPAGTLAVFIRNDSNSNTIVNSGTAINDGNWHYVQVGTAGTVMYIRVDSTITGGPAFSGTLTFGTASPLVGKYSHQFTGKLAQLRVWKMNALSTTGPDVWQKIATAKRGNNFDVVIPARRYYSLTGGLASVWNGSAWVEKPAMVWNGSAWAQKPVEVWTGSAWKAST